MITLNGHFDGTYVVLDEPAPPDLTPGTPVSVRFTSAATEEAKSAEAVADHKESALTQIAKLAKPGSMPPDYAAEHDHYVKGLPERNQQQ